MNAAACPRHPGHAVTHVCDGCQQPLCAECVESGHRLEFCKLCGERALPWGSAPAAGTAPAAPSGPPPLGGSYAPPVPAPAGNTITERRRARVAQSAAGYGVAEALAYPFRGYGAYAFWGFVALLLIMRLIGLAIPVGGGAVTGLFGIIMILMWPSFMFSISGSTARGENELPDWPDFDFFELFRSLLLFLFVAFLCLLPLFGLMYLLGCGPWEMLTGTVSLGACFLALSVGFLVAVALWIPIFGATSLFDTFLAAFRIDLHVAAVLVAPLEWLAMTVGLAGLLIARFVLPLLLGFLPLVGQIASDVVVTYALFLGAHLVGLYFRRHWNRLEAIYLG